jgi:Ca2+-binding RTX toxin-like protein
MKKKILMLLAVLAVGTAPFARAETPAPPTTYTVVLAGGATQNTIHIWLTPDGQSYVIDSLVALEVGGTVCQNAPGNANELICQAPLVAGFVVNGGPVTDTASVSPEVEVPVTMRGGPGKDVLLGGGGTDKLIGGEGGDVLTGRAGDDALFGGPGADVLWGGSGDDALWGGPGHDVLHSGKGTDSLHEGVQSRPRS